MVIAPIAWFPFNYWVRGVRGSDIPLGEDQEGLKVYHPRYFSIPALGKCFDGLFYFFSILFCFCRIRKQFHFDIMDAHFSYPDGVAAALLSKIFDIPLVITVRGTHDIRHSGYLLRKPQIQFALGSARKVICVSESLKRFARELGVSEHRLRVIPNGINAMDFYPMNRQDARQKVHLPMDAIILISVGAVIEGKGHQRVIEIMPKVAERFPNVILVILGDQNVDPKHMRAVTEQIERKNIQQNVRLVPAQPHTSLRYWLNAADLFCLATRSEGRCNAILEALACGLAVVTTDVGGNRELVEHGHDGLLVPFWNENAFSDALYRGLRENWNRDAISQRARALTWERTTADIFAEFERVSKRMASREAGVEGH